MLSGLKEWRARIASVCESYLRAHGRPLRLMRPRRYTEKMQWRKLFDLDPRYVILSDKLAIRGFIAAQLGSAHLVPLLWQGDDPNSIPFDELVPPYVLKSTHASGHTIVVGKGQLPDRDAIRTTARNWLVHCHGTAMGEPGYVHVPPRLAIERQIILTGDMPPLERRFFVFDGIVRVINTVFVEKERVRNGAFHTAEWERLDWHFTRDLAGVPFPRPALLNEMMHTAAHLSKGFDHLRIDIYDCGDRFWIGEMTVYAWSGLVPFVPDEADYALGAFWRLRRPLTRAIATVLTRRWEIRKLALQ
jgi:hypothetical protein